MMRVALPFLACTLFGCARERVMSAHSSWDATARRSESASLAEPSTGPIAGDARAANPEPYRRKTIVLGSGGSQAYDAMMSDRAATSNGDPSNVVIVQQQQTINAGGYYGPGQIGAGQIGAGQIGGGYYGYGPGTFGYGTGSRADTVVRPSYSPGLAPGGNWPTPQQYGPRILGDRSR